MKNKIVQGIHKALIESSKKNESQKKLSFSYDNDSLKYKSLLRDFSSTEFKLFDALFDEISAQDSINSLFDGKILNTTEGRPALHHKYRENNPSLEFDFQKICKPLLRRIKKREFKNIITFGIGGSYEGPKLLQEYLFNPSAKINYLFVSGPDKEEFNAIVKPVIGQKNLYIFASKSLSTDETLSCLHWLGKNRTNENSIVITANIERAKSLGFSQESIIPFPKSVGGRYSIWSPISLSVSIENNFNDFLHGGCQADTLLSGTSSESRKYQKFIKILSFSDIWFSNFRNKKNRVLLTYNWRLRSFANYIQQLEMESLGKPLNSSSIFNSTGQTVYGGFGSTAQHSYFQLLHQGTSDTAADIIFCRSEHSLLLEAQAQGQSDLLSGDKQFSFNTLEQTNGNIPVNLFELKSLSLQGLGFLIASWEHRVFLTSQMLGINPFDQYGVNAGKIAAQKKLKKS